jgi:EmrB/QacA subfamily drug resistance transporter
MVNTEGHPRRWAILGIMSLSLVIVMLNNVTLNVALPELSKDLGAGNSELQWIMDAYALVFGGALLTMGALGDRFGRKRALQLGLIVVGCSSAWTATYADTSTDVIGARAFMGIGAALVMPATLSIVMNVFPPSERGKAIGIWAAMAGIGAPIGLFVGGWAVEHYDWQMVFWINVPFIMLALVLGLLFVPESKDQNQTKLDLVGALFSVLALSTFLYSIIEAPRLGWTSVETVSIAMMSVVCIGLFVWWEKRNDHPMLPLDFFRNKGFSTGLLAISLAFFVMFSFMFTQMLHFQLVRGNTPLEAAVRFLPLPLGLMPAAANSDRLVNVFGRNRVVGSGLCLVTVGMLIFTTVSVDTEYLRLALMFFILGLGMGLTMAPSTELVMEEIPSDKTGVGSATNDASREIGGALGIAIGGSVLNEFYQRSFTFPRGLDPTLETPTSESFPTAMRMGAELLQQGNPLGGELIASARVAFMEGMTTSAMVSACIAFIAALLVFRYMPRYKISMLDGEMNLSQESE